MRSLRTRTRLLATAAVTVLLAASSSAAQERSGPDAAAERWRRLPPEQRKVVRERFEAWRRLPPEERRRVEERREVLERLRREVLEEMPPEERRRLESMPPERRERMIVKRIRRRLEEVERSLAGGEAPARGGGKRAFARLRDAIRRRAVDELLDLVEEGILEADEADGLLDLPPDRLARRLLEIRKRWILQRNPPFLRRLPPEERRRLERLDPAHFFEEVERLTGKPSRLPRLADVPRFLAGSRRDRPLPKILLRRLLGEEAFGEIRELKGPARQRAVAERLAQLARERFANSPDGLERVERALRLPLPQRVRRLVQLLDPEARLRPAPGNRPPGPRPGGRGPRRRRF